MNEYTPGTKVRVGNDFGVVESVEWVTAHPSGMIPLHTINWTHKRVRSLSNTHKLVDSSKKTSSPNCFHIQPA